MSPRRNDWMRTQVAIPSLVLRIGFIVFVGAAALLLVPVMMWQIAAVVTAALGVFFPQTFGTWMAIVCISIGMVMSEPSIWRAMIAVFVVHICHVISSLLLALPIRSRVVLAALVPTIRRLLLVQIIAQPLTLVVMLAVDVSGDTSLDFGVGELAPIIGAGALAVFAILFLTRMKRRERRS